MIRLVSLLLLLLSLKSGNPETPEKNCYGRILDTLPEAHVVSV